MNNAENSILHLITDNENINQRELSQKTGMSLGSVNLALKTMIKKGLIKTRQLTGRKFKYILTPKGFEEKLRRSYNFVKKTITQAMELETGISNVLMEIDPSNYQQLIICGDNDICRLVRDTVHRIKFNIEIINLPDIDEENISEQLRSNDKESLLIINCGKNKYNLKNEIFLAEKL